MICPKVAEVTAILLVVERFLKFARLNTLKLSARSCSLTLPSSPKLMFLKSEKSTLLVGGPLMTPRPPLPTTLATGGATGVFSKQAVLNHISNVCGPPKFGLQITLARLPAIKAGTFPRPAASKFVVTVYHSPDWRVTSPDISQPPSTLP